MKDHRVQKQCLKFINLILDPKFHVSLRFEGELEEDSELIEQLNKAKTATRDMMLELLGRGV
jgi:hypothetical protein